MHFHTGLPIPYLGCCVKCMSEVNWNNPSVFHVHHKVGEVPVPYPQYVLANVSCRKCLDEVGTEKQEGFRCR